VVSRASRPRPKSQSQRTPRGGGRRDRRLRRAGGLRPPAWIERRPNHKRHRVPEALVIGPSLDPWRGARHAQPPCPLLLGDLRDESCASRCSSMPLIEDGSGAGVSGSSAGLTIRRCALRDTRPVFFGYYPLTRRRRWIRSKRCAACLPRCSRSAPRSGNTERGVEVTNTAQRKFSSNFRGVLLPLESSPNCLRNTDCD